VAPSSLARPDGEAADLSAAFRSPEACAKLGESPPQGNRVRIVSWNVRWFPDGVRTPRGTRAGTDVEWLACALAAASPDLVLLQEVKSGVRTERALSQLTAGLNRRGGDWVFALDDCGAKGRQQLAFLFDRARTLAKNVRTVGALNPTGKACKHVRPGLAGYFRFAGGLDLHVFNVHLKSGTEPRSHEMRRVSLASLAPVMEEAQRLAPDPDVLIGGDFNSMGCEGCAPPVSDAAELRQLDDEAQEAGLERITNAEGCSHFYEGQAGLLDHFLRSTRLTELPAAARVRSLGACRADTCALERVRGRSSAQRRLSDHCPILLDLIDVDRD
jgi:endonuclease/exonuclease/phosphatase family metal-dependent hydrolase